MTTWAILSYGESVRNLTKKAAVMEFMDRATRMAAVVLAAAGFAAMLIWTATGSDRPAGAVTWSVVAVVATAWCAQLGSPPLRWWSARLAGATIGLLLLGAVADRLGLLGGPGDPGVSWGDWAHFRSETAELVPWPSLVEAAALAATAAELALGLVLVSGMWWRWAGKGAAGLFFVYLVAMVPGMGAASVLEYGVPVLIGGCLLCSARGPRPRGRLQGTDSGGDTAGVSLATTPATRRG